MANIENEDTWEQQEEEEEEIESPNPLLLQIKNSNQSHELVLGHKNINNNDSFINNSPNPTAAMKQNG